MMLLAVAGGGALGSIVRYLVAIFVARLLGATFPWGTLVINITGSFLMGVLIEAFALRWDAGQSTRAFWVVGICGGYTTFSTFSLDVAVQMGRGASFNALAYILASVVLSVAAIYAGMHLMRASLT